MILFFLTSPGFWWAQHSYSFGMMSHINTASIFLVSFSFSLFFFYNIFYVIFFHMYWNITVTEPGFWLGYRYIQMSCSEGFPLWILLGEELSSLLFCQAVPLFPNLHQAGSWAHCKSPAQQLGLWGAKPYFCGKRGGSGNQSLMAGIKVLKKCFEIWLCKFLSSTC